MECFPSTQWSPHKAFCPEENQTLDHKTKWSQCWLIPYRQKPPGWRQDRHCLGLLRQSCFLSAQRGISSIHLQKADSVGQFPHRSKERGDTVATTGSGLFQEGQVSRSRQSRKDQTQAIFNTAQWTPGGGGAVVLPCGCSTC